MNVVLVGFMASGKSSVGRRVAKRLGFRLLDTDQYIESEQGVSVNEIFTHEGEGYFRKLETRLIQRLAGFDSYVFATGGGIVTTPGNMELLKRIGSVVFLNADPEDIVKRLEHDTRRPNVRGEDRREQVHGLLGERMAQYQEADISIETLGKTPNQVAGEVIRRVSGFRREPPETVPAQTGAIQTAGIQTAGAPSVAAGEPAPNAARPSETAPSVAAGEPAPNESVPEESAAAEAQTTGDTSPPTVS